jgi:hypothetical protein
MSDTQNTQISQTTQIPQAASAANGTGTGTGKQPSSKSSNGANECIELKNLKYKSMMLKNNQKRGDAAMQMLHNTSATDSVSNIEQYLDRERSHKANEPWGRLDKTVKLSKLNAFAKKYIQDNSLPESEVGALVSYLSTCIDHKKIVKTKDVVYDKTTGTIVSIPILTHLSSQGQGQGQCQGQSQVLAHPSEHAHTSIKFTLRRCDKRQSTLKSLPSHSSHAIAIATKAAAADL